MIKEVHIKNRFIFRFSCPSSSYDALGTFNWREHTRNAVAVGLGAAENINTSCLSESLSGQYSAGSKNLFKTKNNASDQFENDIGTKTLAVVALCRTWSFYFTLSCFKGRRFFANLHLLRCSCTKAQGIHRRQFPYE